VRASHQTTGCSGRSAVEPAVEREKGGNLIASRVRLKISPHLWNSTRIEYRGYCLHRRESRWGPVFYFKAARTFSHPGPSRPKEGLQSSRFPYFALMACRYNWTKGSHTLPPPPGRESRRGRVTLPQNVSPWLRLPKVQNALEEGKKEKTR
jgi:hypothetical protein